MFYYIFLVIKLILVIYSLNFILKIINNIRDNAYNVLTVN